MRTILASTLLPLLLSVLVPTTALAARQCYFSYAEFEKAVPHFDIQTCPGMTIASDRGFCRLGLDGANVRIYRFVLTGGESCLDNMEVMPFADFVKRFGGTYEVK